MGSSINSFDLTIIRRIRSKSPISTQQVAVTKPVKLRLVWLVMWFVVTVVLAVFLTPPWFMTNNEYLQTGPEYWFLVIFGNCVIVLISKLQ
jgi:hypothetical protein